MRRSWCKICTAKDSLSHYYKKKAAVTLTQFPHIILQDKKLDAFIQMKDRTPPTSS